MLLCTLVEKYLKNENQIYNSKKVIQSKNSNLKNVYEGGYTIHETQEWRPINIKVNFLNNFIFLFNLI